MFEANAQWAFDLGIAGGRVYPVDAVGSHGAEEATGGEVRFEISNLKSQI